MSQEDILQHVNDAAHLVLSCARCFLQDHVPRFVFSLNHFEIEHQQTADLVFVVIEDDISMTIRLERTADHKNNC